MCLAQTGQFFDASVIAFTALIVAPIVSIVIARMQIRSQLVSSNRVKWIEEVRAQISVFLSEASQVKRALFVGEIDDEHILSMKQAYENVILLLNPEESLHFSLLNEIGDFGTSLVSASIDVHNARQKGEVNIEEVLKANDLDDGDSTSIHNAARAALKYEWERVKRGE